MNTFFAILGFLWCFPVSLLTWITFGFMYLFGQFESIVPYKYLMWVWDVEDSSKLGKWMQKNGWLGFSCGNCILVRNIFREDGSKYQRTLDHEERHCQQHYAAGVFFFLFYVLESLKIYFFCPRKHSYYDNWFEVDARTYAGQLVKIPRSAWAQGPNDRWAWW